MKTRITFLLFIFLSTYLFGQTSYLYQEEFYSQGNWTKAEDNIRNLYVFGGKYYFDHKKTEGEREITTSTFSIDYSKDFEIETAITKISGTDNNAIAFLYDYKDTDDYAEFGIATNGHYRISNSKAGTYSNVVPWTKSSNIITGNYKTNVLKIKKTGSSISYYANGTYLYSQTFSNFIGNRMGIRIYKNQKIAIDYFRVKYTGNTTVVKNNTSGSKTILFEGFNNNNNNWTEEHTSTVNLDVKNGDYNFEHKIKEGGYTSTINKYINTSRNFTITAQIKKVSGVDNNGFGLVFGRKDSDNQNQFFITSNGSFIVNKTYNGTRSYEKNWTKSSNIKTGNGSYNYLKVEKSGSSIKYYINNSLVHTSYNTTFYGSNVGFIVYDKIKIAVGYLSIMYSDSTNTTVVNKDSDIIKESILFDGYTSNINSWSTTNSSDVDLDIKDGDYIFNHKRDKGGWSSTINKYIDTSRDFKILIDIKKVSGILNNGYGLVFGREDSNNQNLFYINGNGSFSINQEKNGKSNFKKNWEKSSAIKTGNGAYNVLKLIKRGNKLEYYINNTKVYTDYSPEFFGDRLGYILYDRQKIAVAYISVGYLDKKNTTNNNTIVSDNVTNFNYSDSGYLFSEQFNNNTNSWAVNNEVARDFSIKNGKYYLNHKRNEKGWSTYISNSIDTSKDFEIETKIDKINGVTNYGYGLIYGGNGDNDFRFYISSSGYYKIVRVVNNNEQEIQKWTTTSYVKTGNQKSNTLKIVKEGNTSKFYINDHFVHSSDFEPFYGDKIGYVVYNNQEIAADYLRIKYNESNNDNLYTSKVLKLPLRDDFNTNTSGWQMQDSDDYTAAITGGKLQLAKKQKGGIFISKEIEIDDTKDFIIETSIARTSDSSEGLYGITFGRQNSSNEYSFLLYSTGGYLFRKFDKNVYNKIIPYTTTAAIKTGINAYNKVKIVKSGSLIRFYINDQYVNETPFEPFFGNKFGYTIYYDKKIAVDYLDIKYQTSSFNNPPIVVISEPNVEAKRGFKIVEAKNIQVKGKATDADGIYEITINGIEASVSDDGTFVANVPLKYGKNDLIVKATDIKQASSTKTFTIKRKSPEIEDVDNTNITEVEKLDVGFGKYYALIIGVSEYVDSSIEDLKGEPTKDAQALADVLIDNYSFESENVTVLKDPTENEIIKEFYNLKKNVGKNDNVLIFYAGHGNYDEASEKGYWMPSDSNMEFEGNVILNTSVVSYIKSINSKHTLLISDACFSGSILKTNRSYKTASKAVQKKYSLPSRRAITSGTLTTVPNKSVFMKYLLKRLSENTEQYLSAGQLFNIIEDPVINNTTGDNQPQYAPINSVGDEGGDFIFIKK